MKANAKVIESLFRKATGDGNGAVAAAIFWAKTRCGWRETMVTEHRGEIATILDRPLTDEEWEERYSGEGERIQ